MKFAVITLCVEMNGCLLLCVLSAILGFVMICLEKRTFA